MIVIDTVGEEEPRSRVAIIGSCRLRTPLSKIKKNGRFETAISQPPLTHTFREGVQVWRHATGEQSVPDELAPYIYEKPDAPPLSAFPKKILRSIDTFIVEMCDSRQIRHGDFYFQNNYFARNFVQKYPKALLAWYRAFCKAAPVDPVINEAAIAMLEKEVPDNIEHLKAILRETTLERIGPDEVLASARAMVFDRSKRWIFVSHFAPPDDLGSAMQDRRALAASVEAAAKELGAEFFDPTRLIEHYGRNKVLRGNGADIYEYAWEFIPTMGEIIVNMVRDGAGSDLEFPPLPEAEEPEVPPVPAAVPPAPTAAAVVEDTTVDPDLGEINLAVIATQANDLLIKVGAERRQALGVEQSGLYAMYSRLLDEKEIVRKRDTKIVQLILDRYSSYDKYCALQAGLGAIPLMLAMTGRSVQSVETNRFRADAIEAVATRLAEMPGNKFGVIEVCYGRLPASLPNEAGLLIAVGLKGSEDEVLVDQALRRATAILFEPKALLGKRESKEDQEALFVVLAGMGYSKPKRLTETLAFSFKPIAQNANMAI
jgi:hypothetical protein